MDNHYISRLDINKVDQLGHKVHEDISSQPVKTKFKEKRKKKNLEMIKKTSQLIFKQMKNTHY